MANRRIPKPKFRLGDVLHLPRHFTAKFTAPYTVISVDTFVSAQMKYHHHQYKLVCAGKTYTLFQSDILRLLHMVAGVDIEKAAA